VTAPPSTETGAPGVEAILDRWRAWIAQAYAQVQHERHTIGDEFAATLIEARRDVRREALDLVHKQRAEDLPATARLMHERAIQHHVRDSPIVGFDEAAVRYTKARTWQACAWQLDPDLPEVQPLWD
jgi:hypothetical protein